MSSYLYGRANSGNPFKARTHTGSKPIDDIDSLAIELLKRMFEAEFVEYRCLSVTSANSIALRVLTEPNDVQLALAYPRGHSDHREMGSGGHRGLKVFDIPFNDEFNIEIDAFTNLVRHHKPKVVVVGSAVLLFPYPFKAMKEIIDETRAKILFDGAYALGPVAGGLFEDPLSQP